MNKSESIVALSKALRDFQKEVEPIKKDGLGEVFKNGVRQYDYQYATLDAIWAVIKPKLDKCGLVIVQGGDGESNGRMVISTMVIHSDSGEWIESRMAISTNANNPQDDGKAITYARRYSMACVLSLMTEEDDDAKPRQSSGAPKNTPDSPSNGRTPSSSGTIPQEWWDKKKTPTFDGKRVCCPICGEEVDRYFKSKKGNWTAIHAKCKWANAHPVDVCSGEL